MKFKYRIKKVNDLPPVFYAQCSHFGLFWKSCWYWSHGRWGDTYVRTYETAEAAAQGIADHINCNRPHVEITRIQIP